LSLWLQELEEYEMASRASAEMKMVGAARQMEAAFMVGQCRLNLSNPS
jgi:hypothetical protein